MTTMIEKLETLAKSIKETNDSYEDEVTDMVDEALDMMLDYDYFGTEGQLDPRGDQRESKGEYFKIDQMLSTNYETKVKINKKELLDCIDRSTLLVKEGDKKPIIMNVTDGNMELKINSFIGSMNEDIDIEKEGKDILIGFNPKFFIDALRVIDEEEVSLYMVNPKAPCFIKDENEKFIYLILPVNFNTTAN